MYIRSGSDNFQLASGFSRFSLPFDGEEFKGGEIRVGIRVGAVSQFLNRRTLCAVIGR
jgi:hypothetical protein